ncbi:hypothetical protein [Paractinoplanes rishiriensis]|uniref:Serine protease n=1 Tax=Paractinoplanes rishiriensis TaxID=1050105 RepID=A0A919K4A4_9ACTN|nr:hypothetical protein [Actinoplanes rishiriensis]GIE98710.1 hypothetical protein Ari01nite_61750 [Actinoplanes rishiriensis]
MRRLTYVLLAGLTAATAATVVALPGSGSAQSEAAAPVWDLDRQKLAANSDVPTFGGSYVDDDGATHVWSTRPAASGRLVHRADYTFAQLVAWRDATRALLALPGVTTLDIDERTNRLEVGVEDTGRDGPAVTAGLARLGVPRPAVRLTRNGPITRTLGDEARPLRGGLKIRFGEKFCSLGFIAQRAGVSGFVTNSHCSTQPGVMDSGKYWQPNKPVDGSKVVGSETADPAYTASIACPPGRKCRRSDSNFVAGTAGVGLSQGHIARPPLNSTIWNGTDTFRIVGIRETAIGRNVTKVGQTTGRTAGTVTNACVDLNPRDTTIPTTLFCQSMATYKAELGDSGAPVFEILNADQNTVALIGIHWGIGPNDAVPPQQRSYFSPLSSVQAELGTLRVCSDATIC